MLYCHFWFIIAGGGRRKEWVILLLPFLNRKSYSRNSWILEMGARVYLFLFAWVLSVCLAIPDFQLENELEGVDRDVRSPISILMEF